MDTALTGHARARMQQRGIRIDALERLLEFGQETFDHHGHVVLYFDKAARRRLARAAKKGLARDAKKGRARDAPKGRARDAPKGRARDARVELERFARCYAVLSADGAIVTVGHRFRRINRG